MGVVVLVLYVVWFLVVVALRVLVQKRRTGDTGLRLEGGQERPGSIERVAGRLFVFGLFFGLATPLADLHGLEPIVSGRALQLAGAVLVIAGVAATSLAQFHMGSEWRIGVSRHEHTDLIVTGPFASVRNPIYTAIIVTAIGFVLMIPNWIGLVAVGLLVVTIELQVRFVEEPHLSTLHGPSFDEYRSRVGRFVPWVGRGRPS
ncbi:MAG: isoprenylcysteine carboxylmethyltransferase family protein [Actinomycetia bacterium]|nr:isoprenylcysteine carboxylmethyltransferase family protein [Actinomycetes bacterium]